MTGFIYTTSYSMKSLSAYELTLKVELRIGRSRSFLTIPALINIALKLKNLN